MSLRFHEISEARHRILNPFTEQQLMLLGQICEVNADHMQLDLACGKGEMLCRWAAAHGHSGVGVDLSTIFLAAAQQRATELAVTERISFVQSDAGTYTTNQQFDIVSCIGATWIGGGLIGTLQLMQPRLRDTTSLLLVGEPFWVGNPPDAAYELVTDGDRNVFTTLAGTLERFESAGFELIEMVLAEPHGWDRYEASQWQTVSDWLRTNPTNPAAPALRAWIDRNRQTYLHYGRAFFNWGVFVLRQRA